MDQISHPADHSGARHHIGGRERPWAVWPVSAMIGVMFMGSTLVTPLYVLYREAFGFSEIVLTLVYAAYVVGNLAALLFFGRLSDRLGRKRTVLPAIAVAVASSLLFLFARSTAWLFLARIATGFAVGLSVGAGAPTSRMRR
jgi:MFS family permease